MQSENQKQPMRWCTSELKVLAEGKSIVVVWKICGIVSFSLIRTRHEQRNVKLPRNVKPTAQILQPVLYSRKPSVGFMSLTDQSCSWSFSKHLRIFFPRKCSLNPCCFVTWYWLRVHFPAGSAAGSLSCQYPDFHQFRFVMLLLVCSMVLIAGTCFQEIPSCTGTKAIWPTSCLIFSGDHKDHGTLSPVLSTSHSFCQAASVSSPHPFPSIKLQASVAIWFSTKKVPNWEASIIFAETYLQKGKAIFYYALQSDD